MESPKDDLAASEEIQKELLQRLCDAEGVDIPLEADSAAQSAINQKIQEISDWLNNLPSGH